MIASLSDVLVPLSQDRIIGTRSLSHSFTHTTLVAWLEKAEGCSIQYEKHTPLRLDPIHSADRKEFVNFEAKVGAYSGSPGKCTL